MNFYKTFDSDYLYCGQVDLPWAQIELDMQSVQNDQTRIQSIGISEYNGKDDLSAILNEHTKAGYTDHNTRIWKTTAINPKLTFAWEQQLVDQLPLDHAIATLTRQDPGQILPWHEDKFFMLRRLYPDDTRPIWRFLLMMEDWKMGHVLQIADSVYHHWHRGDLVVWHPGTMHVSANIGLETKWTCNITGFLNV